MLLALLLTCVNQVTARVTKKPKTNYKQTEHFVSLDFYNWFINSRPRSIRLWVDSIWTSHWYSNSSNWSYSLVNLRICETFHIDFNLICISQVKDTVELENKQTNKIFVSPDIHNMFIKSRSNWILLWIGSIWTTLIGTYSKGSNWTDSFVNHLGCPALYIYCYEITHKHFNLI